MAMNTVATAIQMTPPSWAREHTIADPRCESVNVMSPVFARLRMESMPSANLSNAPYGPAMKPTAVRSPIIGPMMDVTVEESHAFAYSSDVKSKSVPRLNASLNVFMSWGMYGIIGKHARLELPQETHTHSHGGLDGIIMG